MSYSRISFIVSSDKIGLVAQLVAGEVGEFTVTPIPDAVVLQSQPVKTVIRIPSKCTNPEGKPSKTRIGRLILDNLVKVGAGEGRSAAELSSIMKEHGFQPTSASPGLSNLFKEGVVYREKDTHHLRYWRLS